MKDFPLYELYLETLEKLKKGIRPNLILNPEQLSICINTFNSLNDRLAPPQDYLPLLALLDHSRKSHPDLQAPLIKVLKTRTEPELLVHCLTSSLKVIIGECERKGERIPFDFLNALKVPLAHNDYEVLEWSLRVIEQTGHQSVMLKEQVQEVKIGVFPLFNEHKKNIAALREFLLKRWTPAPGKGQ